jgi:hypothetical protein
MSISQISTDNESSLGEMTSQLNKLKLDLRQAQSDLSSSEQENKKLL